MPNTTTTQKEFVIPLENTPGKLAEVATALGKANVDIMGYLCESQGEFGVLRIIPSDAAKTESWLRSTNHAFRTNEVVIANAKATPGELGRVATKLSASGVNIGATYPTATGGLAFAVDDVAAARKALGA